MVVWFCECSASTHTHEQTKNKPNNWPHSWVKNKGIPLVPIPLPQVTDQRIYIYVIDSK